MNILNPRPMILIEDFIGTVVAALRERLKDKVEVRYSIEAFFRIV